MEISPRLGGYINFCRWVAACLVCIGHLRDLIFVGFQNIAHSNVIYSFFFFLANLGHQSVIVFFVLSGFLVGGNAVVDYQKNRFSWKIYLLNRFTRLYTVLIISLILGGACDYIGMTYFDSFNAYSGGKFYSLGHDVEKAMSAKIFFGNLLFLQTIFVSSYGSNGPLWSLANEFWYYLAWPLVLTPFFKKNEICNGLLSIFGVIACGLIAGLHILAYFPLWMLGVLFRATLKKQWHFSFTQFFIAISFFVVSLIISRLSLIKLMGVPGFVYFQDYLLALTFGTILIVLNGLPANFGQTFLENKIHLYLSDFSYSLYALHYPFILCTLSFIFSISNIGFKMQPSIASWVLFCGMLIISYLYSFSVSLITEKQTGNYRNIIKTCFGL